jgi:hypothetical protein
MGFATPAMLASGYTNKAKVALRGASSMSPICKTKDKRPGYRMPFNHMAQR